MNRKKIAWVALLLLICLGGVGFGFLKKGSESSTQFKKITVERGDLSIAVLTTGTVDPETRLTIQSPIAGRVERVLIAQGQQVKKGQVLAWISSTERAVLLDGARSEGAEEVKKWEELYKPTPIIAPINGMIIQRNIQPGQTFSITDPIFVMSDHLIIHAQVDETDIAQVHVQQPAQIVLDAYPHEPISGRIAKIAYDAKTVNNITTYEVDVLPNNVPPMMRSGMTANITFPVGMRTGVLILPSDAIKSKEGRPYVLVPSTKKNESLHREITLGISDGKRVEIISGLSEGETVLEPEYKPGDPLDSSKGRSSTPWNPRIGKGKR